MFALNYVFNLRRAENDRSAVQVVTGIVGVKWNSLASSGNSSAGGVHLAKFSGCTAPTGHFSHHRLRVSAPEMKMWGLLNASLLVTNGIREPVSTNKCMGY